MRPLQLCRNKRRAKRQLHWHLGTKTFLFKSRHRWNNSLAASSQRGSLARAKTVVNFLAHSKSDKTKVADETANKNRNTLIVLLARQLGLLTLTLNKNVWELSRLVWQTWARAALLTRAYLSQECQSTTEVLRSAYFVWLISLFSKG